LEDYEKQEALGKKNQVLRAMLGGFSFTFKIEGVCLKLYTQNAIRRQGRELPALEIDIGVIALLIGIQNEKVLIKLLLKEIKMVEYFRRE